MTKPPRPFSFNLTPEEADAIRGAEGSGGQQTLHRRLVDELDANNGVVTFDDQELGTLIRYMTQYGSGGFQDRLREAFGRNLRNLLGF
jgi:hypothetical protein